MEDVTRTPEEIDALIKRSQEIAAKAEEERLTACVERDSYIDELLNISDDEVGKAFKAYCKSDMFKDDSSCEQLTTDGEIDAFLHISNILFLDHWHC